MNTRLQIIIAVILAVLVAGGGWYYLSYKGGTDAGIPDTGVLPGGIANGTGVPQGDGTDVSQNLILGISNDAALGEYLSAYNGMTLYTFAQDTANVSNCSGDCIANWPPYTVPSVSAIHVPATITGQVGTITRAGGVRQVTYNGAPLYFWKNDSSPGAVSGQGVNGAWFVARP